MFLHFFSDVLYMYVFHLRSGCILKVNYLILENSCNNRNYYCSENFVCWPFISYFFFCLLKFKLTPVFCFSFVCCCPFVLSSIISFIKSLFFRQLVQIFFLFHCGPYFFLFIFASKLPEVFFTWWRWNCSFADLVGSQNLPLFQLLWTIFHCWRMEFYAYVNTHNLGCLGCCLSFIFLLLSFFILKSFWNCMLEDIGEEKQLWRK